MKLRSNAMTRATSKAAFLHMQETGKASTKRAQIMAYVEAHPGCSRGDIVRSVNRLYVNPERLAA